MVNMSCKIIVITFNNVMMHHQATDTINIVHDMTLMRPKSNKIFNRKFQIGVINISYQIINMSCKIIVISLDSLMMHHQVFSSSNNENEMKQNFDPQISLRCIWFGFHSLLTEHYSVYDLGFGSVGIIRCIWFGFHLWFNRHSFVKIMMITNDQTATDIMTDIS